MRSKAKQGRGGAHYRPQGESKRGRLKRLIARATAARINAERAALRVGLGGRNYNGRIEEDEALRLLKGVPSVGAILASWRRKGATV